MPSVERVLTEGVVVGILLIIFVYISSAFLHLIEYPVPKLMKECSTWNETHIMEVTVFLSGFLFHVVCEATGINAAYVKNYTQD